MIDFNEQIIEEGFERGPAEEKEWKEKFGEHSNEFLV